MENIEGNVYVEKIAIYHFISSNILRKYFKY